MNRERTCGRGETAAACWLNESGCGGSCPMVTSVVLGPRSRSAVPYCAIGGVPIDQERHDCPVCSGCSRDSVTRENMTLPHLQHALEDDEIASLERPPPSPQGPPLATTLTRPTRTPRPPLPRTFHLPTLHSRVR